MTELIARALTNAGAAFWGAAPRPRGPRLFRVSDSESHLNNHARTFPCAPLSASFRATMLFCPVCGNMLMIEGGATSAKTAAAAAASAAAGGDGGLRFYCQTCPYLQKVEETMTKKLPLVRKKVDDILGGDKAWENVDQIDAPCPHCESKRAFYLQIQIRSADEPMTVFYKCVQCRGNWSV